MSQLDASLALDHHLVAFDQDDHVDLLLQVAAPEAPPDDARPPSAVALVVDESGSMGGPRLRAARACLAWLAMRLDARDHVALVGFARHAQVYLPMAGGPAGRLLPALAALRAGGTTNLSGGLLLGLEQMDDGPRGGPRVLMLLTDGQANEGITDPDLLVGLCRGAGERGVRVSTVGFGADFDEDLLRAMADAGRGAAHWAPGPEAAPAIFAAELQDLTRLVAQAVSVEVRPGPGVREVECLNEVPGTPTPQGVRLDLGDLHAGETRRVVLRLGVPALGERGPCSVATLRLRSTLVGPPVARHTQDLPVVVNAVSAEEAARQAPDARVRDEVELLLGARAGEEAIRRGDAGDHEGAALTLGLASERLRRHAATSPQWQDLLGQADALMEDAHLFATHEPRARKSATYRAQAAKRGKGGVPRLRFPDAAAAEAPYRQALRGGASLRPAVERAERLFRYEDERDVVVLAAAVLVAVNRAHALVDGDKRASVCLADEFLALNAHRLEGPDDELIALAWWVAAELPSDQEVADRLRALVAVGAPDAPFAERHPAVMRALAA